jgi:ribosomal protein L11 methyltransferase
MINVRTGVSHQVDFRPRARNAASCAGIAARMADALPSNHSTLDAVPSRDEPCRMNRFARSRQRTVRLVAPTETILARVTLDRAAAEQAFAALGESVDPETAACSLFEVAPGRWTMAVHMQNAAAAEIMRDIVAAVAGPAAANGVTIETVAEKDWVAASLAGLAPVQAGRFVVHGAHDRARVPPNRIGIEIEAALAFGTGHHGTTRGCLVALDAVAKGTRPQRVLDVGTGTGVLAIAAARRLRRPVLAGDIDVRAVAAARANARLNRAGAFVAVVAASGLTHPHFRERAPFDLVLANILLGPLQRLARPLARLLAPRGRVVLSGLLPEHANAALAAYRMQGLALERRILRDGWATLVLRRG